MRRQAEEKAAEMAENQETMSLEETRLMLYELRVHQIELEMQNAEIVDVCARYHTIYDLAPVCYFTLSEHGMFLEANITASTMLGVEKGTLIDQQITRFILKDDQDIYYFHHKQLFETHTAPCQDLVQANLEQTVEPQICELRMIKNDGTSFWAHI